MSGFGGWTVSKLSSKIAWNCCDKCLLWNPILRVLIVSSGGGGLHKLSVWLDDTILDEILRLVDFPLRYRPGKIVGAYCFDLILVFHR
jgi:hypothetical protein